MRKQIVIRLEPDDLEFLDNFAKNGGLPRQKVVEHLIHGVLNLDCKPSEFYPLQRAFKNASNRE